MQTKNYSDYLTRISDMIGLPSSGMTTAELSFLNSYFNNNIRAIWQANNWIDVCPFGEARFVANTLHYTNDLSKTTYWTASNVTATAEVIANPLDGRISASSVIETTASSTHYVSQAASFVPGANYQASTYVRSVGGRYLYLSVNDGTNTYTSFFNLASGTVGTQSTNLSNSATITQQANGYWLCQFTFTASTSAGTGYYRLQSSSDGSTLSFTGDAAKGFYFWGNLLQQTSLVPASSFIIPFEQEGEEIIDAIFEVWRTNPVNASYPAEQGYQIVRSGIQLISNAGWNASTTNNSITYSAPVANPVFIYYRIEPPDFTGAAYSTTVEYAVREIVLFEDSDDVQNYWKCVVATTGNQSPDNTPARWEIIEIPDAFFQYALYKGYADWLRQDGQFDKAVAQEKWAQDVLDAESDQQERQQGLTLPMKVATHVTSQARY